MKEMIKKTLILIILISTFCLVSCSSSWFEKTMNTCLDVTGDDLFIVGESTGDFDKAQAIYYPDASKIYDKGQEKRVFRTGYLRMVEFDSIISAYRYMWSENENAKGVANHISTPVPKILIDEKSKFAGYSIRLEERGVTKEKWLLATYINEQVVIEVKIDLSEECNMELYEEYKIICAKLNLHISEEADELITNEMREN